MNSVVEKLKKLHSAMAIEQKDFSIKDLFLPSSPVIAKLVKKYQQEDGTAILEISSISSKYVQKYDKSASPDGGSRGYVNMFHLTDGKKTAAFSNAFNDFCNYFYELAHLDKTKEFNKIEFPGGSLKVKITYVTLSPSKSTYNFEIVDGEINGIYKYGIMQNTEPLLMEAPEATAIEATKA